MQTIAENVALAVQDSPAEAKKYFDAMQAAGLKAVPLVSNLVDELKKSADSLGSQSMMKHLAVFVQEQKAASLAAATATQPVASSAATTTTTPPVASSATAKPVASSAVNVADMLNDAGMDDAAVATQILADVEDVPAQIDTVVAQMKGAGSKAMPMIRVLADKLTAKLKTADQEKPADKELLLRLAEMVKDLRQNM